MELMLAVSVLVASLGWGYSAIHTHVHTQREQSYKSLWEGMMEAAGQLAQEKADVEHELEIADSNYKMAMSQLEKVDSDIQGLADLIPAPEKPAPQNTDEHPIWQFAEANSDLRATWEMLEPGMARRPSHMRYSLWATFCGNLPELDRNLLEDAIEALG